MKKRFLWLGVAVLLLFSAATALACPRGHDCPVPSDGRFPPVCRLCPVFIPVTPPAPIRTLPVIDVPDVPATGTPALLGASLLACGVVAWIARKQ
ncbi:MAG: hypothetical protein Q4E65_07740 [Clostridia bacterium]|nr:hypothetical protein [Clostridia bacterium]